jgi:hypothetical protein
MPPSRAAFARRLRRLDDAALADLLAALFAAGGHEVAVRGRLVVVDGRRRIAVGSVPPDGADAVLVVPGRLAGLDPRARVRRRRARAADATVLGPEALHDRLLHAVDRDDAARLCAERLDLAFDAGDRERRRRRPAALAAALSACLLVAALAVAGPAVGPDTASGPAAPGEPTAAPATPPPSDAASTADAPEPLPVSAVTLRDPDRLERGHVAALRARPSLALNASFVGPRHLTGFDTRRSGYDAADRVTVGLRVGPDGRYRSVRRTAFAGPPRIRTAATLDRYGADGTEHMLIESRDGRRYVRQRITFGGTDLATDWSRRVLSRYLDANRSRVEALRQPDRTWYRIVVREPPPTLGHAARDYRATAVVAPDGLVTRVSVDYVHPGTGAAVAVRLRVDSPATPERPPWVEAGPATAGRDRTA